MKKKLLLLSVILVAALSTGFVLNINKDNEEVTTKAVEKENYLEVVSAIGYVSYQEALDLKSQASGIIESLNVQEGDRVSSKDLLLSINDDNPRLAYESDLLALGLLENKWQDYVEDNDDMTLEEIEDSIEGQEFITQIAIKKLQIEMKEKELEKHQVYLPIEEALVVEVTNSQGEYAQMGQTLLKVVSDKKKFVEVDVDEKYYTTINKGNQVRLITEDASSSVKGIVSFIAPSVNQENGTVSITVEIIESLDMFIENMTVQVDFVTTSIDDAIVISGQYLENDQELYVYTYLGNGQVEKTAVEVFNQNSSQIYITKGLEGNEELVLPEEVEDKDLEIMDKGSES